MPVDGSVTGTMPVSKLGKKKNLVVIGSSTGGPNALRRVFRGMPRLDAAVVIVQHMPAFINAAFRESLDQLTEMDVRLACDEDTLEPGCVYIAPSDIHLQLHENRTILLRQGQDVNFCCPSVDVAMFSVVRKPNMNLIGIILTGMGADGAAGLAHMRSVGAVTVVQEGSTCAVNGMPRAAMELGGAEYVLTLDEIHAALERELGPGLAVR